MDFIIFIRADGCKKVPYQNVNLTDWFHAICILEKFIYAEVRVYVRHHPRHGAGSRSGAYLLGRINSCRRATRKDVCWRRLS